MAGKTSMSITLYDPETSEIKNEYTQLFVPWKLFKIAAKLQRDLAESKDGVTEEQINAMAELVCQVFGNRFTVDDLDECSDVDDMMSVIQQIISRVHGVADLELANVNPPKGNH